MIIKEKIHLYQKRHKISDLFLINGCKKEYFLHRRCMYSVSFQDPFANHRENVSILWTSLISTMDNPSNTIWGNCFNSQTKIQWMEMKTYFDCLSTASTVRKMCLILKALLVEVSTGRNWNDCLVWKVHCTMRTYTHKKRRKCI